MTAPTIMWHGFRRCQPFRRQLDDRSKEMSGLEPIENRSDESSEITVHMDPTPPTTPPPLTPSLSFAGNFGKRHKTVL